jgi:hypothetical protein
MELEVNSMSDFFLKSDKEQEQALYIVNYTYKNKDTDEESKDTWLLGLTVDSQLHNLMDVNKRAFESAGYEITGYSYTRRTKTDNNKNIVFKSLRKDEE